MPLITALVGSVVEAWSEFKVHKARVLMSLIGVAIAVGALTAVAAFTAIAQQATTESFERSQGRPAMISVNVYSVDGSKTPDADRIESAFVGAMERYGIDWWSRAGYGQLRVQLPTGASMMDAQVVDVDYGTMFRTELAQGSWFTERDVDRLAPSVIISDDVWKAIGSPDLRTHPTMRITAESAATAVIIGVEEPSPYSSPEYPYLHAFLLTDAYRAISGPDVTEMFGPPQYLAWVPPEASEELQQRISSDVTAAMGEGFQTDVYRQDYAAFGEDPLLATKLVVAGIAVLILVLGALGLLNITLVTVRTRIREIGIRRSFGATAGRVFFGVMMESVVATFIAGLAGVALAVLALKNPWVDDWVAQQGIQDLPGFPIAAALLGLAAATVVGALTGLVPAIVAVRVKPIDAIRY